jgi:hypothetical protein
MKEWWKTIESQLDEHSEHAPDPWSECVAGAVELTDDQRRFLGTLDRPSSTPPAET